jgi:hypothetical protein
LLGREVALPFISYINGLLMPVRNTSSPTTLLDHTGKTIVEDHVWQRSLGSFIEVIYLLVSPRAFIAHSHVGSPYSLSKVTRPRQVNIPDSWQAS